MVAISSVFSLLSWAIHVFHFSSFSYFYPLQGNCEDENYSFWFLIQLTILSVLRESLFYPGRKPRHLWRSKSPVLYNGVYYLSCLLLERLESALNLNCDAFYNQAVNAGCEVLEPMMDAFWGDRNGKVKDPFGHCWSIASHKWIFTEEEMQERMQEWLKSLKQ